MTLDELEAYFKAAALPKELTLHRSTKILNVRKCVDSYIAVAKQYHGRPIADVFIEHLHAIKAVLDGTHQ
jgi:hypothetical protein